MEKRNDIDGVLLCYGMAAEFKWIRRHKVDCDVAWISTAAGELWAHKDTLRFFPDKEKEATDGR